MQRDEKEKMGPPRYVPSEAVEKANTASLRWWMDILLFAFVAVVVLGVIQAVFLYNSQSLQDQQISTLTVNVTQLDMQDNILLMNITEVNMTNMDKIQVLSEQSNMNFTIIRMELDVIEDILNVSGTGAQSFSEMVINNFTVVNTEIINLETKDMTLMTNISDLSGNITLLGDEINNLMPLINMRMKSINGVNSSIPDGLFFLNPSTGISIVPSMSPNTLDISNTGVITIQGQSSSMGDINLVGSCGLNITAGPMSHEVTIDACQLATSITNIDMTVMNQGMLISDLNATDANLQMQIDALTMSGEIIANMTGMDLEGVNMTLNQLITEVMMLQMQVANLESALSQANNTYVPRGSIIPYGGLAAPVGFLLCDGSLVQTSTYPDLFALIGNDFCVAPCPVGFFAVPDMRGKVPAGQDGATFTVRGTQVGNEMETLSLTHIPTHDHTISSSGTHQHDVVMAAGENYAPGNIKSSCSMGTFVGTTSAGINANFHEWAGNTPGSGCDPFASLSGNYIRYPSRAADATLNFGNGASADGNHDHGGTTGSAGSGSAHPNIQPTLTVGSYIIKT